jgi:thioredoxin-dependent peroxiredoxin
MARPVMGGMLGNMVLVRMMLLVGMLGLVRMLAMRVLLLRMLLMVRRTAMAGRMVDRMRRFVVVVTCHALRGALRPALRASFAADRHRTGMAHGKYPWNRLRPPDANGNCEFDGAKTTKGRHMTRNLGREPTAGAKAPAFTLQCDGGSSVSLRDFKGRNLVLYFYPKADTPGCTKEAVAFSGLRTAFAKTGTDILGVSADPVAAQAKFKIKHKLKIALASDETRKMLQAYGAWGEKSMYGRKYMGVLRKTFLVDRQGRIARVWPKVSIPGHAEDVLDAARRL